MTSIPASSLPLGVLPYSELGTAVCQLGNYNLYVKNGERELDLVASINRNDFDQVIEELTKLREYYAKK